VAGLVHGEIVSDLRVVSWNLFHGRDHPPDPSLFTWRSRLFETTERGAVYAQVNRSLLDEFASIIASADWSACLLQEAPPAWARAIAERTESDAHLVLTSRNQLGPLRRRLARINPDLLGSWEGGSNLVLVRLPWRIASRGAALLNPLPRRGLRERRRMALLTLRSGSAEVCVANLHASAGDRFQAERDVRRGVQIALDFARDRPLVFGGDLNLRPRSSPLFDELERRYGLAPSTAPDAIDHILARNLRVLEPPHRWPPERRELAFTEPGRASLRLRLSDHDPVEAAFSIASSAVR
jgi:endonuclease/exonuclease/phosphatase family metal-dependent hydrolase